MLPIVLDQSPAPSHNSLSKEDFNDLLKNINIPASQVFTQLPDHPAEKLQGLKQRAEKLQELQRRLENATNHQKRDRIIVCIAGAIMAGLVAGIVLGVLFCWPVALASGITLFVLGFASGIAVASEAEKDQREGYKIMELEFVVGIPKLMFYLLTRKGALQKEVDSLQIEVKADAAIPARESITD